MTKKTTKAKSGTTKAPKQKKGADAVAPGDEDLFSSGVVDTTTAAPAHEELAPAVQGIDNAVTEDEVVQTLTRKKETPEEYRARKARENVDWMIRYSKDTMIYFDNKVTEIHGTVHKKLLDEAYECETHPAYFPLEEVPTYQLNEVITFEIDGKELEMPALWTWARAANQFKVSVGNVGAKATFCFQCRMKLETKVKTEMLRVIGQYLDRQGIRMSAENYRKRNRILATTPAIGAVYHHHLMQLQHVSVDTEAAMRALARRKSA